MVTWFWTLSYAIDMWRAYQDKYSCRKLYHFVAWISPAIFTFIGLSALYTPNAKYTNIFYFYYLFICLIIYSLFQLLQFKPKGGCRYEIPSKLFFYIFTNHYCYGCQSSDILYIHRLYISYYNFLYGSVFNKRAENAGFI